MASRTENRPSFRGAAWVRLGQISTLLIAFIFIAALVARLDVASAQSPIPNGVFVRESNGTVWAVLDGQRVGVPIWQAGDGEIAALPQSDRWTVMNDTGALVAGDRPAWLATASGPGPSGASTPPPPLVGTLPTGVAAELLGFTTIQHNWWTYLAAIRVKNGTAQPRSDIKIRLDSFDNGVQVGSVTETVPPIPSGGSLQIVYGRNAASIPGEVRVVVVDQGKSVASAPTPITPDGVTFTKTSYQPIKGATRYDAAVTTTLDRDVAKDDATVNVILRGADGSVVGMWYSGASSLPEKAPAGTTFRETMSVYCVAEAASAEAMVYTRR